MVIRQYQSEDFELVSQLFYTTVNCINAKHYSQKQLDAWTRSSDCLRTRQIVGFGSIDNSGCLDLLFTHKDYQNQGIATALCNELEKGYTDIKTFSSITAKPFFTNRGYVVIKEQEVERFRVKLKNFEMIKNNFTP